MQVKERREKKSEKYQLQSIYYIILEFRIQNSESKLIGIDIARILFMLYKRVRMICVDIFGFGYHIMCIYNSRNS